MIKESKPTITSVVYSQITKDLVITYSDGNIEKYLNVPNDVYESIVNNGKVVSEYLKENLDTNYKKLQSV